MAVTKSVIPITPIKYPTREDLSKYRHLVKQKLAFEPTYKELEEILLRVTYSPAHIHCFEVRGKSLVVKKPPTTYDFKGYTKEELNEWLVIGSTKSKDEIPCTLYEYGNESWNDTFDPILEPIEIKPIDYKYYIWPKTDSKTEEDK